MSDKYLCDLSKMSNKYGSNPRYVLAGGGNTSFKNKEFMFIKGSGTSLSTIKPEEFVKMDRASLSKIWDKSYSEDEAVREAEVLADMMDSRAKGETRRPSVETLLHNLFPYKFILHLHPAEINGLTCGKNASDEVKKLFPDAVWMKNAKPGYGLAGLCRTAMAKYEKANGHYPQVLILQNHGIFFAADSIKDMDVVVAKVMDTIASKIKEQPDFSPVEFDREKAVSIAPALRMLVGEGKEATVRFFTSRSLLDYDPRTASFTPDHIVYCKDSPLIIGEKDSVDTVVKKFGEFVGKRGFMPKIVYVRGLGAFACGKTNKEAKTAEIVFNDAIKISVYSKAFGGPSPLPKFLIDFINNWEVESYRSKVSFSGAKAGRLDKKVAVITGAAQGFGKGIAEQMSKEGAYVVIADMNYDGAKALSAEIPDSAAVSVNVTDEDSVREMMEETVLTYGGIDVFVNNAGIVKAGSLDEMEKKPFEFVTAVNYTGYFLCVKYASKVMKAQHKFRPDYLMDIIEINSKSGLAGSNKNFAYAGSKFGGLGLTQSFAMELAEYNIKVNAICPGNFLDGPLWSDPERGLFVQYLKAGKVPGAKTVADVRKFYEAKVPLGRGCGIMDVARAIFYIIEQEYETGQAVPVTGGQEMLK